MPHRHSNWLQHRTHRGNLQRHKRAIHGIRATSDATKLASWRREPFAPQKTPQITATNLDPRLPLGSIKLRNNGNTVVFNTLETATSLRGADEWASVLEAVSPVATAELTFHYLCQVDRNFRDAQVVVSFSVVVPRRNSRPFRNCAAEVTM